jgi:hypothetical protein
VTADDRALADRLALRALVETYAQSVDRRDAPLLDSLFVDDAELLIFPDPTAAEPGRTLHGREELARITRVVKRYVATTHFIGNHLVELAGDTATGETYCLAHHIYDDGGGGRRLLVWSIRYQDRYVRHDGAWRFAQRRLIVDWEDDRPMSTGERLQP